jgi:hypothetical protein
MACGFALGLLATSALLSPASHADPGDFQAMPGLWKVETRIVRHGRPGKPSIRWHCVFEDADPWVEFANLSVPGARCTRSDEQRTSTSLAWALDCSGHAHSAYRGRVDFDSAQHYVASIATNDQRELVRVEGVRRAACTDPND